MAFNWSRCCLLTLLPLLVPAVSVSAFSIRSRAARSVATRANVSHCLADVVSPLENGVMLSDDMGGTYTFTPRLLDDDVRVWETGNELFKRVPNELKHATVFCGKKDQAWTGTLTLNARYAGWAYVWADPRDTQDGGIFSLGWPQVGTMRWEGVSSGELVIYKQAMKAESWLDIRISRRWLGGVAFKKDDAAAEHATNLQMSYLYFGCRQNQQLVGAVKMDDPLSMTVQKCFTFCSEKQSSGFFGIENGRKCWCAPVFHGGRLEAERCDTPCDGNPQQKCGGVGGAASVHMMFRCPAQGPAELAREYCGDRRQGDARWQRGEVPRGLQ